MYPKLSFGFNRNYVFYIICSDTDTKYCHNIKNSTISLKQALQLQKEAIIDGSIEY